ncbi:MAG: ArsC family transcriptional regulator [Christensenellaceae bacterium]|jgi:arsenate reductase|nr:ArsC family transcriptional regulator [Christensenellaceae bacterium]
MNLQLFMGKKNFDCGKAERWFKERRVKLQIVDLSKKPLSGREFDSVLQSVGLEALIDKEAKAYAASAARFSLDQAFIRRVLFENQALLRTPILRNGQKATAGFCPETWQAWLDEEGG